MNTPIFLHYDRAALDAQYNNRAKVPEFQSHIDGWLADGARARSTLEVRTGIAYGSTSAETVNVFPAVSARGPAPVLVFIHGGYWMALDTSYSDHVALGLVPHGVAVVNVDYALMPGVRMDDVVEQCRAAVAWTLREAASFGGDPGRVWVAGHSAGGHLTAMVAATDWGAFLATQTAQRGLVAPPDRPAGGFSLSGLHDLEPIRLSYLNDTLAMDAAQAARNSPVQRAAPAAGWWVAAVGDAEGPEYLRQSQQLAVAWGCEGARQVSAQVWRDTNHFTIATRLADPRDALVGSIVSTLRAGPRR